MMLPEIDGRGRALRVVPLLLAAVAVSMSGCNPQAGEARDLREACEGGTATACDELAYKVQEGDRVLRDWRSAAELYGMACEGGEPGACVRLARLRVDGAAERRGIAHDSVAATALLHRGCDGGMMDGCVLLADMYAADDSVVPDVEPTGVLQDLGRAAQLYEQACTGGHMDGCTRLAQLYQDGTGVGRDDARAFDLFKEACTGGSPIGCTHLGQAYETGTAVERDAERAAALYEEACGVEVTGCFRLAELLARGGSPEDRERIVELYDVACYARAPRDDGSPAMPESCIRAGEVLAAGVGGARDLGQAARYFRRACNLGLEEACGR
jgi:hypothetical protein